MWRLAPSVCRKPQRRVNSIKQVTCRLLCSSAQLDDASSTIIQEGQAKILLHGNDVFYNKSQVVNRDLSIAVLRSFVVKRQEELRGKEEIKTSKPESCGLNILIGKEGRNLTPETSDSTNFVVKPLRVLEAQAASGLRSIRYALEVEGIDSVVALDKDKVAVEACKQNIKLNGDLAVSRVYAELGDARLFMASHERQFDVVDVDPYGSPSVYLDSAVQCVADGGLLMCTATDMTVLCGVYGEVCYSKYGSYSLHGEHCHEMAIRILLSSIQSHAIRYKRVIVPILSVSVDFYVRVFVRIYTSPKSVKESPSKLSYVYLCKGCHSFHFQPVGQVFKKGNGVSYCAGVGPPVLPNCEECGKGWKMGGPMWSFPMHDPEWVSLILNTLTKSKSSYSAFDKVHGLLTAVSEELLDVPLFVHPHALSATLKCVCPSHNNFFSAVGNAGYRSSGCHVNPFAIKTDAPMEVVWDIMRCWVKKYPINRQPEDTIGSILLRKEPKLQANFNRVNQDERTARTRRFLPNPEQNWGPKPRAGRKVKVVENDL